MKVVKMWIGDDGAYYESSRECAVANRNLAINDALKKADLGTYNVHAFEEYDIRDYIYENREEILKALNQPLVLKPRTQKAGRPKKSRDTQANKTPVPEFNSTEAGA